MQWPNRDERITPSVFVFVRALVALFAITVGASLSSAQDFQSWNEVDLTASYKGVDLLVPLLARVDSNLPNPQLAATGVTADFQLPWHLTLTGGYLFALLPQRSVEVHLPLIAVTPTFRAKRVVVADRNRFEKLIGFGDSPVRYRNRLLVDLLFGGRERWHAFADNEVIFNLTASNWNQNRLQFGAGRQLASRLFLDVYYLRRNLSGGAPTQNVLGTTLRISLRPRREPLHSPDNS